MNVLDLDSGADVLVLAPHFDDSVLDLWSVIARPGPVTVVNVFAGAPLRPCLTEWDRICGATDTREWTERRGEEDARALALAGRVALNLPLVQTSACVASREAPPTAGDVAEALRRAVSAASLVYAPSGVGGHPDHLLVRSLAV